MKPLFIPLKTEFFEAFKNRTKRFEYRLYGPRWNEATCYLNRPLTLSKGYGKRERISGKVLSFFASREAAQRLDFKKCYPKAGPEAIAACIEISIQL